MAVTFHVLNSQAPRARLAYLIQLLEVGWVTRRITLRLPDETAAVRLDRQLWQYAPEAFLPHALGEEAPTSPIRLWGADIPPQGDLLINLHPELTPHWQGYEEVIELLDQSPELIERGRQRWRAYRQQGVTPEVLKPEAQT